MEHALAVDEELQYLYALEQKNLQRLSAPPEQMYADELLQRKNIVKTMGAVAHVLGMANSVVYLAAALFDMSSSMLHGRWTCNVQVHSLAALLLAVKFDGMFDMPANAPVDTTARERQTTRRPVQEARVRRNVRLLSSGHKCACSVLRYAPCVSLER